MRPTTDHECLARDMAATIVSARGNLAIRLRQRRTRGTTTFIYCSTTAFSEFCCLFGVRPHDRVTEALINLHWLPVPGRVEFKLFVLVYKSLNGIAPSHSYIADMLQPVATLHQQVTLRSVINNDLAVPRTRLTFGERAFSVESPRLWSSLPSYHAANIHKRG